MNSEKLVIYPRRSWLISNSVLGITWGGISLWLLLTTEPMWFEFVILVLNFLMVVALASWSLYRLARPAPVLAIGQDGVLVNVLTRQFAKWAEIQEYWVKYQVKVGNVLTVKRTDGKILRLAQSLCSMNLEQVQDYLTSQMQEYQNQVNL